MVSNKASLRITAILRTPVIADEWLPLDGVLLYQHARMDLGSRDYTVPGATPLAQPKGEPIKGGKIPIAIVHAKDWYYRCSWAQWGPHAEGKDAWAKRFDVTLADLVDFNGKRGKIDTSASTYKAYHMPVFYRSALWVEWYCVGDADAISALLNRTTHIGKKTVQGWGRVAKWEIDEIGDDWSIWRDGKLMRGIPLYMMPDNLMWNNRGIYGIRPSYWDRRNQMELALP